SSAVGGKPSFVPPPPVWQKEDVDRWGRLLSSPIPIDAGVEYLLTEWPAQRRDGDIFAAALARKSMKVRMILLDEKQRPLGPVPVASTGLHAETALPLYTAHRGHAQRFRPSDWAGDSDLVWPRKAEDTETVARYMAFATRDKDAPLPLLQLRPYLENPT